MRLASALRAPLSGLRSSAPTVFAPATAPGRAAIALVRLTGPSAFHALQRLTATQPLPPPRVAALRHLRDPRDAALLDQALVLCFPSPKSFTGEVPLPSLCPRPLLSPSCVSLSTISLSLSLSRSLQLT